MKTNLTSLEIHYLVNELQFLIDSKVDNIYNPAKEELILQLHVPNKGKQLLRIISGKLLYLTSIKKDAGEPTQFCMFLRKHLDNARLRAIKQLESERIVEFIFEKDEERKLIVELFGKGNIILCDKEDIILSALVYHRWKDREIRAKLKYSYPKMEYNFFNIKLNDLKDVFSRSEKTIVKCLATELGLGGSYAEEVCLVSNIDKNIIPSKLRGKDIENIFEAINKVIKNKIKPLIIYENKEVKDVVPFELEIYKTLERKELETYNEALDYYFLNEFKEEKPKTRQEKEVERLKRIIIAQEETIKSLENKEVEERKKADFIYQNYEMINNVIAELKKATEKYSWKEIEEKLKGHKLIKSINPKDKTIEIEL